MTRPLSMRIRHWQSTARSSTPIFGREGQKSFGQRAVVAAAALVLCCAYPMFAEEAKKPDIIMATLAEATLYTRFVNPEGDVDIVEIGYVPIDGTSGKVRTDKVGLHNSMFISRFRISHGIIWHSSYDLPWECAMERMPLEDLPLFDPENPKRDEQYKIRYPNSTIWTHSWRFTKARLLWEGILGGWQNTGIVPPELRTVAYCDFLPTSPTGGLLFEVREDWCRVWKTRFTWYKPSPDYPFCRWTNDPPPDEPVETIDAPTKAELKKAYVRPFMVLERAGDYYFLTKEGRLFVSAKRAKKNDIPRQTEVFWFDDDNPIFALISDANTGRQFAFTKPAAKKESAKPVCFEIVGDKKEPFPVDPALLNGIEAKAPLKQARLLAQILIDAKKIEPKPPAKK